MAGPVHPTDSRLRADRRRVATIGIAAALVLLGGGVVVERLSSESESGGSALDRLVAAHGTQPVHLDVAAVARLARAFGITTKPVRTTTGWEAEDDVRSLYLWHTPSAWYAHFSDSSLLLGDAGDRAAICAVSDAPASCRFSVTPLLREVGAAAPTAEAARGAARRVLRRAGLLDDDWHDFALDPGTEPVPCHDDLATPYDCTQQVLRTRGVALEDDLGPGTTAVRWGMTIGPDGIVLTATGRIAERAEK